MDWDPFKPAEDCPDVEAFFIDLGSPLGMLAAGSMLDLLCRRMLVAFIIDDEKVANSLVGSESGSADQPLASFSARIRACQALGLITAREASVMNAIRKLRNLYAHRFSETIPEDTVRNLIRNVLENGSPLGVPPGDVSRIPGLEGVDHQRLYFTSAVTGLVHRFAERVGRIRSVRRQTPHDEF